MYYELELLHQHNVYNEKVNNVEKYYQHSQYKTKKQTLNRLLEVL